MDGRVDEDVRSCMFCIAFVCICTRCRARLLACRCIEPGAVMVPGSRGGSGAGTTNAANRDALGVATVRYHDVCVVCLVVNDILSARVVLSPVVAVLAPVRHMSSRVVTECCANRVRAHYTDASRTQRSAEGPVSNRHARQGRGGSEPPRDAIFRRSLDNDAQSRVLRRCGGARERKNRMWCRMVAYLSLFDVW
jgi:hypothetical protein